MAVGWAGAGVGGGLLASQLALRKNQVRFNIEFCRVRTARLMNGVGLQAERSHQRHLEKRCCEGQLEAMMRNHEEHVVGLGMNFFHDRQDS